MALVGAQLGSEGKGNVAAALADDFQVWVRTGAPNAGHTLHYEGRPWVMRSVPCGWINPDAALVIGAGALLDVALLNEEVEAIESAGYHIRDRLYVDAKATVLTPEHHQAEGGTAGEAHQLIGSTGEGVGLARMARLARGTVPVFPFDRCLLVRDVESDVPGRVCDTAELLWESGREGESILLEGTQGSGLSLTHGPWPYVTSTDTNAAQLAADAGLPPSWVQEVCLVARTYPIRVAGNSGPLERETSWSELGFAEERTTVTKKVRRVGLWDDKLFSRAVGLNAPTEVALTFADYLDPQAAEAASFEALPEAVAAFIDRVEALASCPVTMVGVSGETVLHRAAVLA